jgi:transcriptional regulator with XRE-family HTH domain
MSDISKRILETITCKDISYGYLSDKTGIPKSALQRYATGQTEKIPIDRLEKIASAIGVTTSFLMGWDSADKKEQPPRGDIVFYDRFAYLCKQKGVSVSRGALEAGISKSLVTKWKTNNTEIPSPDVIGKLSKYFGLPVSELLGEEPSKTPGETEKAPMPNDIGEENILRMYRSLSTEEKGAWYAYALTLKEMQKEGE